MKFIGNLWARNSWPKRIAGIAGLGVMGCCGCFALAAAISPSSPPTPAPAPTLAKLSSTATSVPAATSAPAATSTPAAPMQSTVTQIPATATRAPTPAFAEVFTQAAFSAVVVDKSISTNRDALLAIGKTACGSKDVCLVAFWDDASKAANIYPMTDAQAAAQIAVYNFNKSTGLDRLRLLAPSAPAAASAPTSAPAVIVDTATPAPIVADTPTAAPAMQDTPTSAPPTGGGYICDGGAACIKGNINSSGQKLYHFPGCPSYNATKIDTGAGERMFTSSVEAEAAGWSKAGNCP